MLPIYEGGENYTVDKSILYMHEGKLTSKMSRSNGTAVSDKCLIFYV